MKHPRPAIVGIVNVTGDSFSDGGRYLEAASARAHAERLAVDGADIVEVGPASSHPEAAAVSAADEISRIDPVLDALHDVNVPVSIDSWRPETQRHGIERGVAMLNDIEGFGRPEMYDELARATCKLVVMHSVRGGARATRDEVTADGVVESIDSFFEVRLAALIAAGIARDRFIIDPGMGLFLGSNPEASVRVLRGLSDLRRRFDLPVLVSVSRKSFLGRLCGRDVADRGAATLAAELYAATRGVDYIRTHDAGALRDALAVMAALE